ncbi:MAG TPA: HAMP domain-containing sensor histidine kinase [Gemmatimonadaceae bacterium]|nr:HAMP domain-containing sensor histidine kinase [Gemmatimonadaceae bacterium]
MIRLPRHASERTRATITVALLALAVVLTAVLAYQAQDAARSHRRVAERTLRDYASFASWQFEQHARMRLLTTMVSSFIERVARIRPESLDATLPTAEVFAASARQRAEYCDCMDSVEFFFRLDWRDGRLTTTADPLPPALATWVRDTVAAHERLFERPQRLAPLPYGSAGKGQRRLGVVITNDSYVLVIGEAGGRDYAIAYVLVRDWDGAPVAAFGLVTPPRAFIRPVLAGIVSREALLPPSLVRDLPADSVLTVSVSDIQGHEFFRSRGRDSGPQFYAADTMDGYSAHLVVRTSLHPDVAEQLIVGGLPRSRLPLLGGLFALTAGLLAVTLVQLRREQELARLRTDFVAGVSHELRTPLSQIRWFAELLHMGRLRTESERARSARIIDQEARRLAFLVENVLAFSRSGRRAQPLAIQRIELAHEVEEVIEIFAPIAEGRGARLRTVVPDAGAALADRGAIRQILLNLLDNAVKYGPAGQTVSVVVDHGFATTRLAVEDEGPGIAEGERERVFQPFVRLGRTTGGTQGGSGIGLAVVRELAALMGGRVWVETAAGGGARVVVELAACSPAGAPRASGAAPERVAETGAD